MFATPDYLQRNFLLQLSTLKGPTAPNFSKIHEEIFIEDEEEEEELTKETGPWAGAAPATA